ncbi:MAG TPA: DMT family transporter [Stellaceae bacterium]|nr:DMT family transporter [Stellaceae bacterium]
MTPQRRALLLLAVPVVLFGVAWPVNKVALAGFPPLWFAAARSVLGTAVAAAMLLALRQWRLPSRRDFPIIVSVGLLQLALFFAFTNLALSFLPAGRSVVLANTTTLWLVPLALIAGEPIPPLRWAGAAAGVAGILVLANPWSLDWNDPGIALGHGFLLLAALGWAVAIFHARHHRWELSPLQVLPWQMLMAALVLVPLALLSNPLPRIEPSFRVWGGLFYIGVIAGPLASWAAVIVARDLPTIASSVGFLGIPALGLVLSTAFLGESLTWSLALGALLIGAGVIAATARRR